jgi:hypothetical protein
VKYIGCAKMNLSKRWTNHLKNNNMTYCKHFVFAVGHGLQCIKAGIYLMVHGFFPCFFQSVGSDLIHELDKSFTEWKYDEKDKND